MFGKITSTEIDERQQQLRSEHQVPWTPPGLGTAMVAQSPSSGTWKAEYFGNQELKGEPVVVREEKTIDFKLKRKSGPVEGVAHDHFSARWTGTVKVSESGPVVFGTASDDGSRVYVDGKLFTTLKGDRIVEEFQVILDEYVEKRYGRALVEV